MGAGMGGCSSKKKLPDTEEAAAIAAIVASQEPSPEAAPPTPSTRAVNGEALEAKEETIRIEGATRPEHDTIPTQADKDSKTADITLSPGADAIGAAASALVDDVIAAAATAAAAA
eukprot:6317728-Prymnesium_polylepis.1